MRVLINHNISTYNSSGKLMIVSQQDAERHTLASIKQVSLYSTQFGCATFVFLFGPAVVWVHVQFGIERTHRLSLSSRHHSTV
jgi:hypothetical protein